MNETHVDEAAHQPAPDAFDAALLRHLDRAAASGGAYPAVAGMYRAIDACVADARRRHGRPVLIGLCGSQGSGKSTLARTLKGLWTDHHALRVAEISLDDLYHTATTRRQLAREVHPLLATRGVPGTHDVELGLDVIAKLMTASDDSVTPIPRFDKAADDRASPDGWTRFAGRPDIILLEGWCVGARAQDEAALDPPINALEREQDPDGRWRRHVNAQLAGAYRALFDPIDRLILLRAPDFDIVYQWRREQEATLRRTSPDGGQGIMDDDALRHFIMHYERLTRHILDDMPGSADLVIDLDAARTPIGMRDASILPTG